MVFLKDNRWIPHDRVGVVAYSYSIVPIPFLCGAKKGKERVKCPLQGQRWIPQDQVGVVAYNYSIVPIPLLCKAKKGKE